MILYQPVPEVALPAHVAAQAPPLTTPDVVTVAPAPSVAGALAVVAGFVRSRTPSQAAFRLVVVYRTRSRPAVT
jgi:hypothetical protein